MEEVFLLILIRDTRYILFDRQKYCFCLTNFYDSFYIMWLINYFPGYFLIFFFISYLVYMHEKYNYFILDLVFKL